MGFILSNGKAARYSPSEQRLFALLPEASAGGIPSDQLAAAFYKGRRAPANARMTVVGAANSLMKKVARNKEPFRVMKGKQQGPHPIDFWVKAN